MPEFRLLGILCQEGNSKVKELTVDNLYKLLTLDVQLFGMGFSNEDLYSIASKNENKGIRQISNAIVSHYARCQGLEAPKMVFIKHGELLFVQDELLNIWPDSIVIHLVRDGRAVANSLLQTEMPYFPFGNMGRNDIVFCANYWQTCMNVVLRLRQNSAANFTEVLYENLTENEEDTLTALCDFIGCSSRIPKRTETRYVVNEAEYELHKNVNQPTIQSRSDAWKSELNLWQGVFFEMVTKHTLALYGYSMWYSNLIDHRYRLLYILRAYFVHIALTCKFLGKIIVYYLLNQEHRLRVNKRIQNKLKARIRPVK